MNSSRIIYTPRPDATPETEAAALAAVYRFLLDCHPEKKGGVRRAALDDALKGSKDERANEVIIPNSPE